MLLNKESEFTGSALVERLTNIRVDGGNIFFAYKKDMCYYIYRRPYFIAPQGSRNVGKPRNRLSDFEFNLKYL